MDRVKKKILLVEDEIITAMLEKEQLENYGYSVTHVMNGEDAVKQALDSNLQYDLILMDIDLGLGIDGTQAAEEILKEKDIPVVFLSSHIEPEIVEKTENITSYGYIVKSSSFTVLDASIKMALKLYSAKSELNHSKEKYRLLIDNSITAIASHEMIVDEKGKPIDYIFKSANAAFEIQTGLEIDKIIGKKITEVLPGIENTPFIEIYGKVALNGESISFEQYSEPLKKYFLIYAYQIKYKEFATVFIDISERILNENYALQSKLLLNAIIESPENLIIMAIDKNYNYLAFNKAHRDSMQFAYNSNIELERSILDYITSEEDKYKAKENYDRAMKGESHSTIEKYGDENKSYYESRYNPILNEKNEVIGITAFASDITERIQREETIQKQLAEKEILLKEVYHRIKNSIISIESLLLLQGESSLNVDVKTALKESVLRIQSIRVLYEKLLLSNHYQNVSIKNYIDSLIDSLIAVFPESKKVFIERQIMDFRITTRKAIPLGIIINELITNIFKHAFNEKTTGHILIELYKSENQGILTIQDNGVGMEESFPTSKSSGYGLSIVKMLVQQILGTYTVENMNGTKSIIQFEIEF